MNTYKFLVKPIFYIASLFFSTALVLYIEKLSPSDLGRLGKAFETPVTVKGEHKMQLKKLLSDYKAGKIDSTQAHRQIEMIFSPEKIAK